MKKTFGDLQPGDRVILRDNGHILETRVVLAIGNDDGVFRSYQFGENMWFTVESKKTKERYSPGILLYIYADCKEGIREAWDDLRESSSRHDPEYLLGVAGKLIEMEEEYENYVATQGRGPSTDR